jgi:DNA-directed RNA polymerase beta' subunit
MEKQSNNSKSSKQSNNSKNSKHSKNSKECKELSQSDIDFILDFISLNKALPPKSAKALLNLQRKPIENQLRKIKLKATDIPELKRRIQLDFMKTIVAPGESVGIIAAQSIGEKSTQSTLNSFHASGTGVKLVLDGIPRLNELLMVPKQPKLVNSKIYFYNNNTTLEQLREHINNQLVHLNLKTISLSMEYYINNYNTILQKYSSWIEQWTKIYERQCLINEYKNVIEIKIDLNFLYRYRLPLYKVADIIEKNYSDIQVIYSPIQDGIILVTVDTKYIKIPENLLYINEENKFDIYMEEVVIPSLEEITICGINGIKGIFFQRVNGNENEWFVETEGTNFKELLSLPDFVDYIRTTSNNVWDIYYTLGIEAARYFLINELHNTIGKDINISHIELMVDRIIFKGIPSPITRHTLKNDSCGVMSKASFEQSVDIYLHSAFNGETEKFTGVSASVICGKRAYLGSGMMDLSVDTKMLMGNVIEEEIRCDL